MRRYQIRVYGWQKNMKEYIVIARKYRPQKFSEVVGQEHVTKTLQNALKEGKIGHSYLFSGPRGVGKTTVARILSKALNCEKGVNIEPCNECSQCTEITNGRSQDVLEIDGASNRRIEEVRNLKEGIGYAPIKGRYKVYIVDEVHMLTNEAFNALLKTLEEPPPHTVFIFATTEPYKVPSTILSRCQRFDFRKLTTKEIYEHIKKISETEKIMIQDEAIQMISERADGALRDAEVMLDQLRSYTDETIKENDVKDVFGFIDKTLYKDIIEGIIEKDDRKILQYLENVFDKGYDLKEFIIGLIEFIRNLFLIKLDVRNPYIVGEEHIFKDLSNKLDEDTLAAIFNLAVELDRNMRNIPYSKALLELYLLKMARVPYIKKVSDLLSQSQIIETKEKVELKERKEEKVVEEKTIEEGILDVWEKIKKVVNYKHKTGFARILANSLKFIRFNEERKEILLENPSHLHYEDEHIFEIENIAKEVLELNVRVKIIEKESEKTKKNKSLYEHPVLKKAIDLFGGTFE